MRNRQLLIAMTSSLALAVAGTASAAGDHAGGHDNKQPEMSHQGDGGHHGGGHHGGGHHDGGGHHGANIGAEGDPADVSRTIDVVMRDNLYEPEKIRVKEGETVRFRVSNEGQLVHEFNLGTAQMHANHQEQMMAMVQKGVIQGGQLHHERMKQMGMSHDHANSVLLEPGESREIVWRFSESGDFEFACNVPGHYESGMKGDIHFK